MARKTYNEKLNNSGDLPKIQYIGCDNKMASRMGCGNMLIAAPLEYDRLMKKIHHPLLAYPEKGRRAQ